jgi:hypothetical protein
MRGIYTSQYTSEDWWKRSELEKYNPYNNDPVSESFSVPKTEELLSG